MGELLAACRVDKRGRITIPKAVRDKMGWKGGDIINYKRLSDGSYQLRKVRAKRAR